MAEHKTDWESVTRLLTCLEQLRGYPNLSALHDRAVKELEALNEEPKPAVATQQDRAQAVAESNGRRI